MQRTTRKLNRSVAPFLMALVLVLLQTPFTIAQKATKRAQAQTFAIAGEVHPAMASATMLGRATADQRLDKMILVMKPHNEAQLNQLLADQQDPKSPRYHQFLSPEQFGNQFGATEREVAQVTQWLQASGLTVEQVQPGRLSLNVSGYANQVEKAFGTTMANFSYRGKEVISNTTEPQVPMALSSVVGGVIGLSGFHRYDYHHTPAVQVKQVSGGKVGTNIAVGANKILGPADFAKVYNVNPLYAAGTDGTGQSIAIVARCDFNLSDTRTFRSNTGLPAKDPVKVFPGANPGVFNTGEESEVLLDAEWSGAVAKNATIKVVIGNSTSTTDGVDTSAQYIVNNNVAPVVSISFGACESAIGTSANTFYNNLFQQGAAQGQSIFVSSGDSGAAACTNSSGSPVGPAAVSGLCSTPYNVAVGGTSLTGVTFDASGNLTAIGSEVVWNDGSTGGSTGGGVSSVYSKPSWQVSPGVPADGKRDLPDVSLMGSPGKIGFYLYQGDSGGVVAIGGTSASSPAMAGIMSLVVQKYGAQGNPNPKLYSLGNAQYGGTGATIYRDITSGNNSFAGVTGYTATAGFDRATGLGAPDANALVTNWNGTTGGGGGGGGTQTVTGSATPNTAIPDNNTTGITSTINIGTNLTIQSLSVTVGITHTYSGDIQLDLVSPTGTTVRLKSTSGTSTPNINATYAPTGFNGQLSAGAWKLVVKDLAAADTGTLNSWSLSITGTASTGTPTGDFSLALTKTDGTSGSTAVWARGSTYARIVTVTRTGSFTGPVTLSYSVSRTGVLSNVTTSVNPVTSTTSQMNFSVSSTSTTSPATITIIGTDSTGRQRTATIAVTLQ